MDQQVMTLTERRKWFTDRIGKRVWRMDNGCNCAVCTSIRDNGLVIYDASQASYLADTSIEYGYRYFDSKEELNKAL